jgi:hypothetical protein
VGPERFEKTLAFPRRSLARRHSLGDRDFHFPSNLAPRSVSNCLKIDLWHRLSSSQ